MKNLVMPNVVKYSDIWNILIKYIDSDGAIKELIEELHMDNIVKIEDYPYEFVRGDLFEIKDYTNDKEKYIVALCQVDNEKFKLIGIEGRYTHFNRWSDTEIISTTGKVSFGDIDNNIRGRCDVHWKYIGNAKDLLKIVRREKGELKVKEEGD